MTTEIGTRLRAARMERGLSLRSVAQSLGVSASLISQVETGKTQPSVSTLYALVNHLGVSMDDLLGVGAGHPQREQPMAAFAPSTTPQAPAVQRSEDNPVLEMENGVRWERLAIGSSDAVDALLVTYAPGGSSSVEGKLMRHSGSEYAYILEGELTMQLDFDRFVLRAGDSLQFDSMRPHMYLNTTDKPTRGVWFVLGRRQQSNSLPDVSEADAGTAWRPKASPTSSVDLFREMDRLNG